MNASTLRYFEQFIIDTDPTDECAPVPLNCKATTDHVYCNGFCHYYCDATTCIDAAFEAYDDRYNDDDYYYYDYN